MRQIRGTARFERRFLSGPLPRPDELLSVVRIAAEFVRGFRALHFVVPGASQLFEEPGALERVADLAASWVESHLAHGAPRTLPTIA